MHVLMVEDDLDLGRALLQGLKAEGVTTEWMRRAADALRFTEYAVIDCLLLDLSLPGAPPPTRRHCCCLGFEEAGETRAI